MLIVFGTRFCGKIATVNNQWIESKFFSIMFIPIFPVSSMFVTSSDFRKRKGFTMGINNQSVAAVYGRMLSLIFAGFFLFIAFGNLESLSYGGGSVATAIIFFLLGIACGALCVYFYAYYAKSTPGDVLLRQKVGRITGNYALPNWFDYVQQRNLLNAFELKYKQQYPEGDWKADLQNGTHDKGKIKLLYGIALFNCMVNDLPENDELYAKADELFVVESEGV